MALGPRDRCMSGEKAGRTQGKCHEGGYVVNGRF